MGVCFVGIMNSACKCRSCGTGDLESVLDLGMQPLANNLLKEEDLEKSEPRFPLHLMVCMDCWLLQIADLIPPVDLFSDYIYFSSFSDAMLRHAEAAAERHISAFGLNEDSLVVEIASNDGYFLRNFVRAGIPCLGVEPAANIAKVARDRGIETWTEFFGRSCAESLVQKRRKADLILGNNVFAHAPDANDFVAGLRTALADDGRIVLEFPYAVDFIEKTEFDTIYHEHVFYFSLTSLQPLFERHGLAIFRAERIPIHGGSLRLFACQSGRYDLEPSVGKLLEIEKDSGLASLEGCQAFSSRARSAKAELARMLAELKAAGHSIAAYGASAKGSTLLNFVSPDPSSIDFIADRSTYKQGRYSPGLHLPIVAPEKLLETQPDYTLLLTWNFADEIMEQQKAYRENGGRFIIPIPEVEVF